MLKYDQIQSPMSEPLVQHCRGLILDEANDWAIVAWPFNKFFNHGEPNAHPIDWSTAKVQEKLDGSLMILYWYAGLWHVASSGTPDAGGPVGKSKMTFEALFWKVWEELGYGKRIIQLNPKHTYSFELMTPENRVVVAHQRNSIKLIGIRDNLSGREHAVEPWATDEVAYEVAFGFQVPKTFDLKSHDEIERHFGTQTGLEQEGFVVVDANFNRLKVKHPNYVKVHHMIGSLTTKKVLDCVRRGEAPEVLTQFPEWKAEFERVSKAFDALCRIAAETHEPIRNIVSQKEFAAEALKTGFSSALFAVRSGKFDNFRQYFSECRLEPLCQLLNIQTNDDVVLW